MRIREFALFNSTNRNVEMPKHKNGSHRCCCTSPYTIHIANAITQAIGSVLLLSVILFWNRFVILYLEGCLLLVRGGVEGIVKTPNSKGLFQYPNGSICL